MALTDIEIDTRVHSGFRTTAASKTCALAAAVLKGKKIKEGMRAMIVPGRGCVRANRREGLADSSGAGFEWRLAGLLDVSGDEP